MMMLKMSAYIWYTCFDLTVQWCLKSPVGKVAPSLRTARLGTALIQATLVISGGEIGIMMYLPIWSMLVELPQLKRPTFH